MTKAWINFSASFLDRKFLIFAMLRRWKKAVLEMVLICSVCFDELFGDVNIFSIVLSKKDNFFNVSLFFYIKFTEEEAPPLPPMRSLHWSQPYYLLALIQSCYFFCFLHCL